MTIAPSVSFVVPLAPKKVRNVMTPTPSSGEGLYNASAPLRTSVTALLAVGASAVLASRRRKQGGGTSAKQPTARLAVPEALQGTGGPNVKDFWDPAGLAKGKSEEQLLEWRAVELKHGRVAMLACLGWFHVAGGWHPIGDAAARTRVSDNPLVNVTQLPMAGAWQVVFTIMCLEWLTTYVCKPPAGKPWDILGWTPVIAFEDGQDWKDSQLKELNNGRLAMIGIVGLIAQDLTTGQYFAEIAKPCFGNIACTDLETLSPWAPWPKTPFVPPELYPRA